MKKIFLILVFLSIISGCDFKPENPNDIKNNKSFNPGNDIALEEMFPPGAYDFEHLGNGWHTFKLKIFDKERKFLWRRLSFGNASTEVLTEIN
jgi:hypothetical protein